MTRVWSSTAVMVSIGPMALRPLDAVSGSRMRSNENLTSWAVTARPLVNLAFLTRWNVHSELSSLASQVWASCGSALSSWLTRVRLLKIIAVSM